MVKVFHAKHTNFVPPEAFNADAFVHVANVDTGAKSFCSALEQAFELTNSIDEHWSLNKGVEVLVEGCRSSSVGDVFEFNGKKYAVECIGFVEIK